jgi:hypothetical protein
VTHGARYEASAPDTADYLVTIDFDDLAGPQAYLRHPAHEKLGARFGESINSGLVYDFEGVGLSMTSSRVAREEKLPLKSVSGRLVCKGLHAWLVISIELIGRADVRIHAADVSAA